MKALGLVVSDKKIFENCILKTYFLTSWPTYATNWNGMNNFGRGPPRDRFYEVCLKSNERFQRRKCLRKKLTTDDARRTTTHDGQRPVTIAHPEHFVLRWAKMYLLHTHYKHVQSYLCVRTLCMYFQIDLLERTLIHILCGSSEVWTTFLRS